MALTKKIYDFVAKQIIDNAEEAVDGLEDLGIEVTTKYNTGGVRIAFTHADAKRDHVIHVIGSRKYSHLGQIRKDDDAVILIESINMDDLAVNGIDALLKKVLSKTKSAMAISINDLDSSRVKKILNLNDETMFTVSWGVYEWYDNNVGF